MFSVRNSVLNSLLFIFIITGQTHVFGLPGESVVLEVIEDIEKADLFESDKGFLKRWAYVETQFGQSSGHLGGIWRIDHQQLKETQTEAQNINGSVWSQKINQAFGINWVNVEMQDLDKPLVSCLAARILLSLTRSPLPVLLIDQAALYQTLKVKTSWNVYNDFIAKATEYEKEKALESVRLGQSNGQQKDVDTCKVYTLETVGLDDTSNFIPGIYDAKGELLIQFHKADHLTGPSLANVVANAKRQNKLKLDAEYDSVAKVQQESLLEMYKIKTGGFNAKSPFNVIRNSGIYDSEDRKVIGFQQGYNIITIDNGHFVRKTFFVWNNETHEMATYLKSIPYGKTVIIATMDEAKDNRFANGIPDLIYDIGGSKAVFGGDAKYRSVYVLVGQKGAGSGKCKEYFRGAVNGDSNAWLTAEFFVSGNKIFSENGVAEALLETIKFLGANAKQYPSSKDVYEMSASKPFEVEDMLETHKRNRVNLKASFYF